MATIEQQLNQLKTDKQDLVNNLKEKGVEATDEETFTSLVPKVKDISGGSKYAPRYISFQNYTGTELDEEVTNLDTSNLTNMQNMFYSCSKLQQLDLKNWKTDLVTNMNGMFMSCNSLQQLDLSSWTMEKVEDVNQMFYMCSKLTKIDLSSWKNGNTGVNFSSCFYSCKSLQELDMRNIDFTKVILFSGMMSNVPENCKFIVKDETQKERVQKMFPNLTNIVTVTELGEE